MNLATLEETATPTAVSRVIISGMRNRAQAEWASLPVRSRLQVLKRARHGLAARAGELVDAIPSTLARNRADSYAAEIMPLLVACQFLERNAAKILRTKELGMRGLPLWLVGVKSSVERVPLGTVLVIAPSNYPLYLPGVQALQGLAAGNAVVWKPGLGGGAVAAVMAAALSHAGLPDGLFKVTDESTQAAVDAMQAGADKIFFTGSGAGGAIRLARGRRERNASRCGAFRVRCRDRSAFRRSFTSNCKALEPSGCD